MKKKLFCLFSAILIVLCLATPVHAENAMGTGGYRPPMVTIITLNGPRDLQLTMRLHLRDGRVIPVKMEKKTRGWEQQYRIYREDIYAAKNWYGNAYDLLDAELVLISGGRERVIPLEQTLTDQMTMDDVLMLNVRKGSLSLGAPAWRTPLLALMRVLIAVGLELLIFRLRGFVLLHTHVTVAIISAVTFGLLSVFTANWLNYDSRSEGIFCIFLLVILVAQILAGIILTEEDTRDRTLSTLVMADVAASVATVLALTFLPV